MDFTLSFFVNSILLGVGLAMDAFSVSLANGLNEPHMKQSRMSLIAGTFAFFQFFMPMVGWICVRTAAEKFSVFEKFIPWIAFIILAFIGGKMIIEGIKNKEEEEKTEKLTPGALAIQGVATSIDALSVGFTISGYRFPAAFICAVIIAVVTFAICIAGLIIGRKFGTKFSGKASVLGGVILVGIGIEIFVKGVFFK